MKYLIYIFVIPSLLFAFNSCGGSGGEDNPITIDSTKVTKDDLIGTWEIYHSRKDIVLNGLTYTGFRDPEMDGFRTKFYKDGDTYKFIDYNPVLAVVDQGTYDIDNGHIIFTVTQYSGRDTLYTTKQNVTNIVLEEGLLYVDYSYTLTISGQNYQISDLRRLRNIATAPGVHPNVTKVDINFDDYVGTWELYDADVLIDGRRNIGKSETLLDKPNIRRFKFYYNDQGQKVGENQLYQAALDTTTVIGPSPVVIIDDVIHLLFKFKTDEGIIGNDGIFLWIVDRQPYTDPTTNELTIKITDKDEYRDQDKPTDLYERKRYFKKVE